MSAHQHETETDAVTLREYALATSGVVALVGGLYFIGLLLVIGFSMTFLSYYQAIGAIETAQVAWLSAPAPLPQFYWYTVPAPIAFIVTPIAFGIAAAAARGGDK